MADEIQVSISQASVKQIIEAKVQAAIVEALTPNADAFIEVMVSKALNAKATGEKYRYERTENIPTVLGEMVTDMLREETKAAIARWLEANKENFAKKFDKALRDDKTLAKRVTDQMLAGLIQGQMYRFNLNIQPYSKD